MDNKEDEGDVEIKVVAGVELNSGEEEVVSFRGKGQ